MIFSQKAVVVVVVVVAVVVVVVTPVTMHNQSLVVDKVLHSYRMELFDLIALPSFRGNAIHPYATMHFPCFSPPIFEKNFRHCQKLSQFYPFPKKFDFHPPGPPKFRMTYLVIDCKF